MPPLHLDRTQEERLRRHGEELELIRRPVRIQQRLLAGIDGRAKRLELARAHLDPAPVLAAVRDGRHAVDRAIQHVQLVGELVIDDVRRAPRVPPPAATSLR